MPSFFLCQQKKILYLCSKCYSHKIYRHKISKSPNRYVSNIWQNNILFKIKFAIDAKTDTPFFLCFADFPIIVIFAKKS